MLCEHMAILTTYYILIEQLIKEAMILLFIFIFFMFWGFSLCGLCVWRYNLHVCFAVKLVMYVLYVVRARLMLMESWEMMTQKGL